MLTLTPEAAVPDAADPTAQPTVLLPKRELEQRILKESSSAFPAAPVTESTLVMSLEDVRSSLEGFPAPTVLSESAPHTAGSLELIPALSASETLLGLLAEPTAALSALEAAFEAAVEAEEGAEAEAGLGAEAAAELNAECKMDALSTHCGTLFPHAGDSQVYRDKPIHAVLAGRYELLCLLGVGGMGSVYLARDRALDELVALKILRPDKIKAPGILERFKQEVRLSRRITHRNVARMFDIGEDGGTHFLTMELVEGTTLAKLMAYSKPSPLHHVLDVAIELCEGLQAAHDAGVVHRDLKPENILIQKNPKRVVITDFGIAWPFKKPSEGSEHAISGTPTYMAPEQVEDRPLDGRADLFALGVILFEALTGAPPWQDKDVMSLLIQRLKVPAPPLEKQRPDLPRELCRLVNALLSPTPEGRPASAKMVQQALKLCHAVPQLETPSVAEVAAERWEQSSEHLTLAILPFQNLGNPDDAHFVEGLMEDIYDGLSGVEGVRVIPRFKTRPLAGFQGDVRTLKTSLGADSVLEGSVRRHGSRVRLTARLSCTQDGIQLWSRRFERGLEELLMLGDEAAHELAEALACKKEEQRRLTPTAPEAIELYLMGRREYNKSWGESHARALEHLAHAYALAPEEPLIMACYAMALSRRFAANPVVQQVPLARKLAEQSLLRAPQLGEAHMALAWLALNEGDAPTAAMRVRRALKLSPGLADPYDLAGRLLVEVGAVEEGLRLLRTALNIEPSMGHVQVQLLRVEGLLGRFAEAERLFRTLPSQPETLNMAIIQWPSVLLWNHRPDLAMQFAQQLRSRTELQMTAHMSQALEAICDPGRVPEALQRLWEIFHASQNSPRFMTFILQLCAELAGHAGLHERAFEALVEVNRLQHLDLLWLERCPQLEGARKHPGYPTLHADYLRRAAQTLAPLQSS